MHGSSFPVGISKPVTLRALLKKVPGPHTLIGDDGIEILSFAPLGHGMPGSLVFSRFTGEKARDRVLESEASVVITAEAMDPEPGRAFVQVQDPRGWFIDALNILLGEPPKSGIHPTAVIGQEANLGEDVSVGAYTVIQDGAEVGHGCAIGSNCFLSGSSSLSAQIRLASHVSIGCSGLAFHERPDGSHVFFRHAGRVFIGDHSSIGTHSTVMRGILDDTVIGEHAMIGNQVNVGHNCQIGDHAYISSGTVLAGASQIGAGAVVAAGVRVSSHIRVGMRAVVGIGSVVVKDVKDGERVFGNPSKPLATMRKF